MTKQKALEAVEEVVKDITRKMPTTTQIIKTERENIYNAIVEMVESEFMSTGEGVHEPYILGYNQALTDLKQNLQVYLKVLLHIALRQSKPDQVSLSDTLLLDFHPVPVHLNI